MKFASYSECDEFHYGSIDGQPGNHDPSDGHMDFDEDKAEAAIQQLVERCLPAEKTTVPAAADLYERAEQLGNVDGFKEAIDQFRHNLQQAGLLRGDDV